MTFKLGKKSLAELEGVHPDLVAVVKEVIQISLVDFAVHDGLRTEEEQEEYARTGVSTTLNSKHLPQPDGYGHAVDLVPYINGKLRWEWAPAYQIAAAFQRVSMGKGVKVRWGGVWDRQLNRLRTGPWALREEVEAYVDRRRKMKRRALIDGPHFELV